MLHTGDLTTHTHTSSVAQGGDLDLVTVFFLMVYLESHFYHLNSSLDLFASSLTQFSSLFWVGFFLLHLFLAQLSATAAIALFLLAILYTLHF